MALLNEVKALFGNTYAKGDLFEDYVRNLFPDEEYGLVHVTPRANDHDGRKIESRLMPDFQFRHRRTNHLFWVECKYRADLFRGKLQWCEPWQLERFKKFQESSRPAKVFIVIGLGGKSSKPHQMYCIPLDEIQYPGLYPNTIAQYLRPPNNIFRYSAGRLY